MRCGKSKRIAALLAMLALLWLAGPVHAETQRLRAQVLYVPAYSEIPFGDLSRTLNLSATLSVRNTDLRRPIQITRIDYYSAGGQLVRSHLERTLTLAPLASEHFVVKESDRSGGVNASFILAWQADTAVSPPLVQTVMVSTISGLGVSFIGTARAIEERP